MDARFRVGVTHGIVQRGLTKMKNIALKFLSDESGAAAIEYGLIAAGISLAIIGTINGIDSNLIAKLTAINSSLK